MARAGWQVMYHGATSCYHLEAPRQPEPLLGRRLDSPAGLPPLAPPLGLIPPADCRIVLVTLRVTWFPHAPREEYLRHPLKFADCQKI